MSAPLLWIVFPLVLGFILYGLRRWNVMVVLVGVLVALFLAILARLLPIGERLDLGVVSFTLSDTLTFLGRRFTLINSDRSLLSSIYFLAAFWFAAAYVAKAGNVAVPLGLTMIALLTAALAVEPFIYAALLVELVVLASIPILVQPESSIATPGQQLLLIHGSLRFLSLQTLGLPFLLLTVWFLTGVEIAPTDPEIVARIASLAGFGFALLLAIFPFHSWVLMLAEHARPYAVAFVFLIFFWMVSLYGLRFFDRYEWLRDIQILSFILQVTGSMMVLVGGISSIFENHMGRMLGYAVMVETGYILLAASLPAGFVYIFISLLPRALALGSWSLALAVVASMRKNIRLENVAGFAQSMPIVAGAIGLAHLALAGLPFLAAFPARLIIWLPLASQAFWAAILVLIGTAGLLISAVRTIIAMAADAELPPWSLRENWQVAVFLSLAMIALVVVGIFPQWFFPALAENLSAFENLLP